MAEYGWTSDFILTRTRREITWLINSLAKRKRAEKEFQAALQGKELKGPPIQDETEEKEFSEEQDAILEHAMQEAQKRKRMEWVKHGG